MVDTNSSNSGLFMKIKKITLHHKKRASLSLSLWMQYTLRVEVNSSNDFLLNFKVQSCMKNNHGQRSFKPSLNLRSSLVFSSKYGNPKKIAWLPNQFFSPKKETQYHCFYRYLGRIKIPRASEKTVWYSAKETNKKKYGQELVHRHLIIIFMNIYASGSYFCIIRLCSSIIGGRFYLHSTER